MNGNLNICVSTNLPALSLVPNCVPKRQDSILVNGWCIWTFLRAVLLPFKSCLCLETLTDAFIGFPLTFSDAYSPMVDA